ncbi:hypothetical protein [Roseibium sp. M-1]
MFGNCNRRWLRTRGAALVTAGCLLAGASVTVQAQEARPDTRRMTCSQAQDLVRQRGTIVLTTGPSTFDRFVANGRYCEPRNAQVRAKFAPTKDNPQCSVGYRCYQNRGQR